jgi:hypothetical protein
MNVGSPDETVHCVTVSGDHVAVVGKNHLPTANNHPSFSQRLPRAPTPA